MGACNLDTSSDKMKPRVKSYFGIKQKKNYVTSYYYRCYQLCQIKTAWKNASKITLGSWFLES